MSVNTDKPRLAFRYQPSQYYSMRREDRQNAVKSEVEGFPLTLYWLEPVNQHGEIIVVCVDANYGILYPNVMKVLKCKSDKYFARYKFSAGENEIAISNLIIQKKKKSEFQKILGHFQAHNINLYGLNEYNEDHPYSTTEFRLCFIPCFGDFEKGNYEFGDPLFSDIIFITSDSLDITEIIPSRGKSGERICFVTSKGLNKPSVEAKFYNNEKEKFTMVEKNGNNIFIGNIPDGFYNELVQVQLTFNSKQECSNSVDFRYENKVENTHQQEDQQQNVDNDPVNIPQQQDQRQNNIALNFYDVGDDVIPSNRAELKRKGDKMLRHRFDVYENKDKYVDEIVEQINPKRMRPNEDRHLNNKPSNENNQINTIDDIITKKIPQDTFISVVTDDRINNGNSFVANEQVDNLTKLRALFSTVDGLNTTHSNIDVNQLLNLETNSQNSCNERVQEASNNRDVTTNLMVTTNCCNNTPNLNVFNDSAAENDSELDEEIAEFIRKYKEFLRDNQTNNDTTLQEYFGPA